MIRLLNFQELRSVWGRPVLGTTCLQPGALMEQPMGNMGTTLLRARVRQLLVGWTFCARNPRG